MDCRTELIIDKRQSDEHRMECMLTDFNGECIRLKHLLLDAQECDCSCDFAQGLRVIASRMKKVIDRYNLVMSEVEAHQTDYKSESERLARTFCHCILDRAELYDDPEIRIDNIFGGLYRFLEAMKGQLEKLKKEKS